MFKNFLRTLLVIPLITSSTHATSQPVVDAPRITVVLDHIRKIKCSKPTETRPAYGTAFYIGEGIFITAEHVADMDSDCVDVATGAALPTFEVDKAHDIAFLSHEGIVAPGMPLSCNGFTPGKTYHTFGFALAKQFVMNVLKATKFISDKDFITEGVHRPGMRELDGLLIQGMSGGPVVDEGGIVVGINNVTGHKGKKAWSYPLKDTSLCKNDK